MSIMIYTGGPAFPRAASQTQAGGTHHGYVGMTLRDYFAAQALAGFCASSVRDNGCRDEARFAYAMADAMLAARERTEGAQ